MARRDQLTYDVEVGRTVRSIPWPSVLLLAAVVLIVTLLVAWVVTSRRAAPAVSTPSAPVVSAPASPVVSASPLPSGTDAGEGQVAPEGSQATGSRFVTAWLDHNPTSRKAALTPVAAAALTEQLMLTDPANIPAARATGVPTVDEASTYSVQLTQALSDGQSIRVYLVADPQAKYGWLVTSVERG